MKALLKVNRTGRCGWGSKRESCSTAMCCYMPISIGRRREIGNLLAVIQQHWGKRGLRKTEVYLPCQYCLSKRSDRGRRVWAWLWVCVQLLLFMVQKEFAQRSPGKVRAKEHIIYKERKITFNTSGMKLWERCVQGQKSVERGKEKKDLLETFLTWNFVCKAKVWQ